VKNLLPGAIAALRERRLQAGESGVSLAADDAGLAEKREELAAALDAAMGAYVDVGLRQLLLAGALLQCVVAAISTQMGTQQHQHLDMT